MTQQGGLVNFWIHDSNGNPQVIKVQTQGKTVAVANAKSPANSPLMRAIIKSTNDSNQQQVLSGNTLQCLRTVSIQPTKPASKTQLVTIPIQTPSGMKVIQNTNQQKGNYISPILDHSGSRKRQEVENLLTPEFKRRRTEKGGKGLRHFSMKVCEKVKKKGTTSYNEVADELVEEFTNPHIMTSHEQYDQKNIRRRVYDALNVLMAMNIISKEKKEIKWLGLPTNSVQECRNLLREKKQISERIKSKTQRLHDLLLQQISFKRLVERNTENEKLNGMPTLNSAIQLPFIIVNTSRKTIIDCSISDDKTEYQFVFTDHFQIHDDMEVLKRMGLVMGLDKGKCSDEDLEKAKSMVPKALEKYILQLAKREEPFEVDLDEDEANCLIGLSAGGAGLIAEEVSLQPSDVSGQISPSDVLSPSAPSTHDYSDEESDLSSDVDVN